MIKVLLIDPFAKSITEHEIEEGLQAIYDILDCNMIEAPVTFPPSGDALYCDEEAWLHAGDSALAGFMFPDWSYAILGKALIVGTDEEDGVDIDCTMTVDDFDKIIWKESWEMEDQARQMGLW